MEQENHSLDWVITESLFDVSCIFYTLYSMKCLPAKEIETISVLAGGRSDKIRQFIDILCDQQFLEKTADGKVTLGSKYRRMNFFSLLDLIEPELSQAIMDADTESISKLSGANISKEEADEIFLKTCCFKVCEYIETPSIPINIKYNKPVCNEENFTIDHPLPVIPVS